jgi:nucleoside-diphosphate-sugar epimerase
VPLKSDPNYNFYQSQIKKNINPQVAEISIQLVYAENQKLIGRMASYNKLQNGIPIEILPYDNEEMWGAIDLLSEELLRRGLKGPINIQGRMTEKGLKVFEMNPRFTGITGLRSLMGFNEVEACIKDFLNINKGKNQIKFNTFKFGMRQTADKAALIDSSLRVKQQFEQLHPKEKPNRKPVILITGSTGFLGRHLVDVLHTKDEFEIWHLARSKEKLKKIYSYNHTFYDHDDFEMDRIHLGYVDTIIHLGFARPHTSDEEIAKSVSFSNKLFTKASLHHSPYIINISSQSVYGADTHNAWTEKSTIQPKTNYGHAKHAVESMLRNLNSINLHAKYTSIRLSTLIGVDENKVDFISKMIDFAIKNSEINVLGGNQILQRLDVRDASDALAVLLSKRKEIKNPVYNLGSNEYNSVLDTAKIIKNNLEVLNNNHKVTLTIKNPEQIYPSLKLDSSIFYKEFDWAPQNTLDTSIKHMIKSY